MESSSLRRTRGAERRAANTALLVAIAVIVLRAPNLFYRPRFWAEEATIYFHAAYHDPHPRALLGTHLGYYSLLANVAGWIGAHLLPLEFAPLACTLLALAAQVLPLALLTHGEIPLLRSTSRRCLAVAVLLCTQPNVEVWLVVVCAQFHLAVAVFLVALEQAPAHDRGWLLRRVCLVAVAGLTGVVACFLAPVLWLRAIATKRVAHTLLASLLSACAVLQLKVAAGSTVEHGRRVGNLDVWTLSTLAVSRTVIEGFMGDIGRFLTVSLKAHCGVWTGAPSVAVFLVCGFVAVKWLKADGWIVIVAFTLLFGLSTFGAVGTDKMILIDLAAGSGRYFFAPAVVFKLSILFAALRAIETRKMTAGGLLLAGIVGSFVLQVPGYTDGLWRENGNPSWQREVAVYRRDPLYDLQVWPAGPPRWYLSLRPAGVSGIRLDGVAR